MLSFRSHGLRKHAYAARSLRVFSSHINTLIEEASQSAHRCGMSAQNDPKLAYTGPVSKITLDNKNLFIFHDAEFCHLPDLEEVRGNKARKFKDLWTRLVQMKRDSSNGEATDSTTTTAAANVSTSVESEDEDSMSTSSSTGQKVLCSYGGEQSNAMLALARMASALDIPFVYFTLKNAKTNWLQDAPEGNYAAALDLGMQVIGVNQEQYDKFVQSDLSETYPTSYGLRNLLHGKTDYDANDVIFIPQGGNFPSAESGVADMVDHVAYSDKLQGRQCRLIIACGTGALAYYANKRVQLLKSQLNVNTGLSRPKANIIEVVAIPVATSAKELRESMTRLSQAHGHCGTRITSEFIDNITLLPRILQMGHDNNGSSNNNNNKKQHNRIVFASLKSEYLQVWHELENQNVEADLIYTPHALCTALASPSLWNIDDDNCSSSSTIDDENNHIVNIYYNCGGTEGNRTMLKRYRQQNMLRNWNGRPTTHVSIPPELKPHSIMDIIGINGDNYHNNNNNNSSSSRMQGRKIQYIQDKVGSNCTIEYQKRYIEGKVSGGEFIISADTRSAQIHAECILRHAVNRQLTYQDIHDREINENILSNNSTTTASTIARKSLLSKPHLYDNIIKIHNELLYLKQSNKLTTLEFPISLSSVERLFIHCWCQENTTTTAGQSSSTSKKQQQQVYSDDNNHHSKHIEFKSKSHGGSKHEPRYIVVNKLNHVFNENEDSITDIYAAAGASRDDNDSIGTTTQSESIKSKLSEYKSVKESAFYRIDSEDLMNNADIHLAHLESRAFKEIYPSEAAHNHPISLKKKVELGWSWSLSNCSYNQKNDYDQSNVHESIDKMKVKNLIPLKLNISHYTPANVDLPVIPSDQDDDYAMDQWTLHLISKVILLSGQSVRGDDLGKILNTFRLKLNHDGGNENIAIYDSNTADTYDKDSSSNQTHITRHTYTALRRIQKNHGSLRRFCIFFLPRHIDMIKHDHRSFHVGFQEEED